VLTVQPDAACELIIDHEDEGPYPCGALSRFVVERSVDDPAYSPFEACEGHLVDAVLGMADGDTEVPLVVTVRWDKPEDEAGRLARVMQP
jgi:hypothetical protein